MKEFLRQKNVAFTEKDVSQDDQAFEEVMRLGVAATPVTVIDGEVIIGFNRARLEELLAS